MSSTPLRNCTSSESVTATALSGKAWYLAKQGSEAYKLCPARSARGNPAGDAPETTMRYHALDSLRAAMMFLGIYLHAVNAYSPNGGWPWKQAEKTEVLDWSMSIIHVFRMPIFYAMAGFFAAMLLARYGFRRAAWNRFMRIVVPFVVGWMIVWPLTIFLAGLGYFGLDRTLLGFASGRVFYFLNPTHLWFLEYPIVFYVLAAIGVALVPMLLSEGARKAVLRGFRAIMLSPWAPLVLAVPSFAAQLLMV